MLGLAPISASTDAIEAAGASARMALTETRAKAVPTRRSQVARPEAHHHVRGRCGNRAGYDPGARHSTRSIPPSQQRRPAHQRDPAASVAEIVGQRETSGAIPLGTCRSAEPAVRDRTAVAAPSRMWTIGLAQKIRRS